MIFDSDFILYLKEESKEQPYFALKVDNTDILLDEGEQYQMFLDDGGMFEFEKTMKQKYQQEITIYN